ncbi:MAG: hypothetical protein HC942_23715 [Microcoleus sp. SU_5_6]|nr:hypothetical protein [Microcoleus sp. SU_5_6]
MKAQTSDSWLNALAANSRLVLTIDFKFIIPCFNQTLFPAIRLTIVSIERLYLKYDLSAQRGVDRPYY